MFFQDGLAQPSITKQTRMTTSKENRNSKVNVKKANFESSENMYLDVYIESLVCALFGRILRSVVSGRPALGIQICGCRFPVAGSKPLQLKVLHLSQSTFFFNILHNLLKIAIFLYVGCSDKAKMSPKLLQLH